MSEDPLIIDGTSKVTESSNGAEGVENEKQNSVLVEYFKPEIISIGILSVAIIIVIAYSELKKKKRKTNVVFSTSQPVFRDDQSSAEASVSPDQPERSPLHDARVQNPRF